MKPRIAIVVEDDPSLQEAMSAQLARMGFTVRGALHYDVAVQHLEEVEPELICIDLELPTMSGYEICEYIRGTLCLTEVPILVTSDSGHPEHMAYAEKAGANAFLRKPFSMKDLAHYVDALIHRRKESEPYMRNLGR
jgi:two-component system chemotaxis response regulator CheY